MRALAEIHAQICEYVRPATFPLALRLVKRGEDLPERAKRPFRDFGEKMSLCQVVTMTRRHGWAMYLGAEDAACPIQRRLFGLDSGEDDFALSHPCAPSEDLHSLAGGAATGSGSTLTDYAGVLVAPIARATFAPDVFVVYGNSAQVMVLMSAWALDRPGEMPSSVSAAPDCADVLLRTAAEGRPRLILPCNGSRVYGHTEDWEMAFSTPACLIDGIIDGLVRCHERGIQYPVLRSSWSRTDGGGGGI
ncbi:MAG: DUF169 domain-containing protein [Acidobacteriota bacterium]